MTKPCSAAVRTGLVVALAFLTAPRAGAAPEPARGPRLIVETTVADLGEVVRGRVVRADFVLKNTGSEALLVESAKPG